MPRYRIIANPVSARGAGARRIVEIEQKLARLHLDYELIQTSHPWHAAELARRAVVEGIEVVAAAGGDGTSNEVINGLMAERQAGRRLPILAVLPIGRGNDFAFSMGAPADLEQSMLALEQMQTRTIDIGHLAGGNFPGGRFFGNGVGIGFDAITGLEADRLPYITGFITYLLAAIRTIFIMKAPTVEITLDGEQWVQPSMLVSVMNGRRLGGGFWTAPQGLGDDGLFDLCIASEVSRLQMFALIPRFMKGTQASHPAIRMARARQVKVTAIKGSLVAHADGELISRACPQLELELLPRQLELVVSRNGPMG
jgi:diacylglycerol kinase (ATP)